MGFFESLTKSCEVEGKNENEDILLNPEVLEFQMCFE